MEYPSDDLTASPDLECLKALSERMADNRVQHPSHYNTDCPVIKVGCGENKSTIQIECIDVIRNMPTWKGNAVKYLWRAGLKTEIGISNREKEIEDLRKAIFYIEDRIKILENER